MDLTGSSTLAADLGMNPSSPGDPPLQESAGFHLTDRVVAARPDETVKALLERLHGQSFDYVDNAFLVNGEGRLCGMVTMAKLLAAPANATIDEISEHVFPFGLPDTDQENLASLAIRHGVSAVPVVDENYRLLGVVTPLTLIEVLRHEHIEDLHRLAGISRENVLARTAIESPPLRRARDRLPWLLAGLLGSMIATVIVAHFEHALQSRVAIAFFVPGIVYLADAIGTQTEAIAVRGLSLSHAPFSSLIGGELRTGMLIGITLGVVAFPLVWLAYGDLYLGLSVSLALVCAGSVATTVGILFPWLLAKLGKDPAFGSGPISTIVQDVLSLLIYFCTVSLIAL